MMIYFVVGFLGSGFIGMVLSFSLLREIYDPVLDGWEHTAVVVFAITMILSWWGGLIWLVSNLVLRH